MWASCCRNFIFSILILNLFFRSSSFADEEPKPYHMFTKLPSDLKVWWRETFRKESLPYVLTLSAASGLLLQTDYETWQITKVKFDEDKRWRDFMIDTEKFGGGYFQIGTALSFMGFGYLFDNKRARRTSFQIAESIFASGILVQVSKRSTGRESPKSSLEKTGRWRPFPSPQEYAGHVRDYDAVPSGHLSSALTTLVVVQENYPEYKWIPWVGYPLIGLLCLSFSATSIHWWSDYPLGIYLGYHFGKIVTRNNNETGEIKDEKESNFTFFPTYDEDGTPLLSAVWQF
ncbi:MAG: hypothetical protein A4S09_09445 [Proteobacteria bacterium SG_bin7]|nr:MAG: hypothetical protein A4S09_09445 [Proteobacteria bacterium SG_bin7]